MHIFPNGKRYIGITSRKPTERWHNGKGYKKQFVYKAIKKKRLDIGLEFMQIYCGNSI